MNLEPKKKTMKEIKNSFLTPRARLPKPLKLRGKMPDVFGSLGIMTSKKASLAH